MGCGSSSARVEPGAIIPAYCIKDPVLSTQHIASIRKSWKIVIKGGKPYVAKFGEYEVDATLTTRTMTSNQATVTKPAAAAEVDSVPSSSPQLGPDEAGAAATCPFKNEKAAAAAAVSAAKLLKVDTSYAPVDEPKSRGGGDASPSETSATAASEVVTSPTTFFFDAFYGRLFEVAPGVRPLFADSIKTQGRALISMIAIVVHALDQTTVLKDELELLAVKHLDYGALPPHYGVVGEVLLHALATCLGEGEGGDWTDEVKGAWLMAYSAMMSIMMPIAYATDRATKKRREVIIKSIVGRKPAGGIFKDV